ncbi:synaptotagmin-like protein 2 isoform X1 [Carassius gibelio]|uniref:synaptotagmin-like protein 2 isoform X1 n=1 Tax=Carassius gibelio TaxID=101364 RepID=UPI0022790510|nr:synaptotagmin-like protein 2 isoform X1 [Carassius gibelio]XP_052464043.1 synaptotagmin-like protein 2 isoform X1 [Carassius gibelio]
MIDLSYLTEEEQEMILAVLKRDAELKKLEEQRIKQLRKTERDRSRLKYLTGEWFYETKNHRHRDRIHGSDIIRASMREKKPVTILELSQRWSEKPSRAYGEKKDVYIPPELLGLIDDPSTQTHIERVDDELPEAQQDRQRPQIKPRKNPFNSVQSQRDEARLINGVKEADQTPAEEPFLPAENYTLHHTTLNTDHTDTHIVTQCKPCKDSSLDTASSYNGVKQVVTPAPKGILKHNISSHSSTVSLHLHIPISDDSSSSQSSAMISPVSPETPISPPLSPCSVHSASECLDRKQVRFSSVDGPIERVQGEHSVLEEDWSPMSDQDRSHITDNGYHEVYGEPQSSQVSNFHDSTEVTGKAIGLSAEGQTDKLTVEGGRSFSKVLEWFGRSSLDGKPKELPVKKEVNEEGPKDHKNPEAKSEDLVPPVVQPKNKPPSKPRRGLFALFSRAEKKDLCSEVQAFEKEEISQDKTESSEYNTSCTLRPKNYDILPQTSVSTNRKTAEILQEKTDKPICEDPPQKETFDQGEISPRILANLKSSWERGNSGPKILSIKTESENSKLNENYHNAVDRRLSDSSISPSKPKPNDPNPVDIESTICEISPVLPRKSSNDVEISAVSSHEDLKPSSLENNRVSEVLSSELQTLTTKMNGKLSPSALLKHKDKSLGNELQEESLSRDISDLKNEISTFKTTPSQQENKVSINFWELEKSGLRVTVGSPTCTANVKDPSPESSPKRSLVEHSELQFDIRSINPSSPERMSFNEAASTQKEKMEQTEEKQRSPNTVPLPDLQDIRGDSEDDSPVKAALERANARPISISKSLEDLSSTPLQERWKTDPRSDVRLSMENVSAVTSNTKTSFSDPEQVKMMSMSVPAFMQQEMACRNSDCASFYYDGLRTCNTPSNFSTCSEGASMSSVTGSVMSIYSGEFGHVEIKGTIQFAIHYVQKLGEFHIFVVQCKDLAVADVKRNRSDPYVKCYLLPDKAKYGKKKTCVRKKTLDPAYNEILRFKIPLETLKTQKLNTSVWHNDTFGRNMFLGEVELDLAEWDFSNTQMNEYLLKGRVQVPTSPKHSVGSVEMSAEIKVALRFVSQTSHNHKNKGNGEVQIWVKECKNLPITRGVAIDPFVKCAVLPDASRKSRQKTRVLKRTSNPVFNHTMVYEGFRQEDLKEACVELTVWDHDRLNNHFIGGIRLGLGKGKSYGTEVTWMDSNVAEAALWERMMQSPNEWVEDILPLRMMVMARMSR